MSINSYGGFSNNFFTIIKKLHIRRFTDIAPVVYNTTYRKVFSNETLTLLKYMNEVIGAQYLKPPPHPLVVISCICRCDLKRKTAVARRMKKWKSPATLPRTKTALHISPGEVSASPRDRQRQTYFILYMELYALLLRYLCCLYGLVVRLRTRRAPAL